MGHCRKPDHIHPHVISVAVLKATPHWEGRRKRARGEGERLQILWDLWDLVLYQALRRELSINQAEESISFFQLLNFRKLWRYARMKEKKTRKGVQANQDR